MTLQPLGNAKSPMLQFFGTRTSFKLSQRANALSPIVVTLSGITTLCKFMQQKNAPDESQGRQNAAVPPWFAAKLRPPLRCHGRTRPRLRNFPSAGQLRGHVQQRSALPLSPHRALLCRFALRTLPIIAFCRIHQNSLP